MTAVPPFRVDLHRRRLCRGRERHRIPERSVRLAELLGIEHGDRVLVWRSGRTHDRPIDGAADFEAGDYSGRSWRVRRVIPIGGVA